VTTLINVAAAFAFFAGLVFMATYHAAAPWRRSAEGQNLMLVSGGVTGLFGLRMLALVFGEGFPGQLLVRLLLFVALAVGLSWRWWLMLRAQMTNLNDRP
jgi:hypothetical protein